jgi:L-seryl-tRNA(Ser) seleniumtransferase
VAFPDFQYDDFMNKDVQNLLKNIPKMDSLLDSDQGTALQQKYSRDRIKAVIEDSLSEIRNSLMDGSNENTRLSPEFGFEYWTNLEKLIRTNQEPNLKKVINGTGIILHTNLGRAPLATPALEAIQNIASGFSNLEFDLRTGKRGSRYAHVEDVLKELTGAESALVVNNNAAAVMLVVNTLAKAGEVVTSRGELIEIGGSFRIPDVIERSEAEMVEVGTTNKTRVEDFRNAISEKTKILLKVHPSNYRVVGFTGEATREELVELAGEKGLLVIEDLGSGSLVAMEDYGLSQEPTVQDVLKSGVDLVTFSGDKLLGGPQAGLILGKKELIDQMKSNPLLRALRMDKLTLAALDATLRIYYNPANLTQEIPLHRMLSQPLDDVVQNAKTISESLNQIVAIKTETMNGDSYAGGGSLPGDELPSCLVIVSHENHTAHQLQSILYEQEIPVIGRIHKDQFILDARTIQANEIELVLNTFRNLNQ